VVDTRYRDLWYNMNDTVLSFVVWNEVFFTSYHRIGKAARPTHSAAIASNMATRSVAAEEVVSIRVAIEETETLQDGATRYILRVSKAGDGSYSYRVRRRYRQFDALQKALKLRFNGLPTLPGKAILSSTAADDAKRRSGLEAYIRSLVADSKLALSDDVVDFLELSSALELFGKMREKESASLALMSAKDDELEKMRVSLASSHTERTAAVSEAASVRQETEEAKAEAERNAEERVEQALAKVTEIEAAKKVSDRKALRHRAAEVDALAMVESLRAQLETAKGEAEVLKTEAARATERQEELSALNASLTERLQAAEANVASLSDSNAVQTVRLQAAGAQAAEVSAAMSEVTEKLHAAESEAASLRERVFIAESDAAGRQSLEVSEAEKENLGARLEAAEAEAESVRDAMRSQAETLVAELQAADARAANLSERLRAMEAVGMGDGALKLRGALGGQPSSDAIAVAESRGGDLESNGQVQPAASGGASASASSDIGPILMQGWVLKVSSSYLFKNWRRRYLVLRGPAAAQLVASSALSWYRSPQTWMEWLAGANTDGGWDVGSQSVAGELLLGYGASLRADAEHLLRMTVLADGDELVIECDDELSASAWRGAIESAIAVPLQIQAQQSASSRRAPSPIARSQRQSKSSLSGRASPVPSVAAVAGT
jgi:chemotaxis protein histidine kinase CheA